MSQPTTSAGNVSSTFTQPSVSTSTTAATGLPTTGMGGLPTTGMGGLPTGVPPMMPMFPFMMPFGEYSILRCLLDKDDVARNDGSTSQNNLEILSHGSNIFYVKVQSIEFSVYFAHLIITTYLWKL